MHESINRYNEQSRLSGVMNLIFLRKLYACYNITLLIVLITTSVVLEYEDPDGNWFSNNYLPGVVPEKLGPWFTDNWIAGVICWGISFTLIILTVIIRRTRQDPINYMIYVCFTFCFSWGFSWLCAQDTDYYVYFAIWEFYIISTVLTVYSWASNTEMTT